VKIPVHLHTHSTTGVAPMVLLRAVDAGVDGVDTAISALSGGSGHVCTEPFVESLHGVAGDTGLKQESFTEIAAYVRKIRPKYAEFETNFSGSDPRIFISQIPGGMISNMESQLKQQGCIDRLDEVLHEVPNVRKDMGYIPLVTPTSQIVGTQAVLNVLMGKYKNVSRESRDVFAGKYGRTPAPVNPDVQKQVLNGEEAITCRPADLIPNEWDKLVAEAQEKVGEKVSDDHVLSYAVFPQVWVKFWQERKAPKAEPKPAAPAAAPAAKAAPQPAPQTAKPSSGSGVHAKPSPLKPGSRHSLSMRVNGRNYTAEVEVVD